MRQTAQRADLVANVGLHNLAGAQTVLAEQLRQGGVTPRVDEPMARHTTLKVGGPVDLYVRVSTIDELCHCVSLARGQGVPYLILGRGSNVLVSDKGIRGCVIENRCQEHSIEVADDGAHAVLSAESGASLPALAHLTAQAGWAGLEWAIGIPGSIGSAVVNNAGAHSGCIADVLRRIQVLTVDGTASTWSAKDLDLAYRSSRFKGRHGAEVILSAEFVLTRASQTVMSHRLAEFTEHRRRTQPTDPSLGSMFKNPPGDYAGRLIDRAGLKGTRVGGAMISRVHANFFVNAGQAAAADFLALINLAQETVQQRFGVELELEIELVGEW